MVRAFKQSAKISLSRASAVIQWWKGVTLFRATYLV